MSAFEYFSLAALRSAPDEQLGVAASSCDQLAVRIQELQYLAERVMGAPVIGPRGQQLTLNEAKHRGEVLGQAIDMDEMRGSLRHLRVSPATKRLTIIGLAIVDFPIMLWLASSVFNVNWNDPLGLPLVISAAVSILATGGAEAALYHLGHNHRENKNHRRQLSWTELTRGSQISLVGAALLVGLIAVVMFVRVYTEGNLSGLANLALLLAILVSFVTLISATLVFWLAFRDGSPEQDDLAHYSDIVQHHLQLKRSYEDKAVRLMYHLELIWRQAERENGAKHSIQSPVRGPVGGSDPAIPDRLGDAVDAGGTGPGYQDGGAVTPHAA